MRTGRPPYPRLKLSIRTKKRTPLKVHYDPHLDSVTIDGIDYSADVFRELGKWMPLGQKFRLLKREYNTITIERLDEK